MADLSRINRPLRPSSGLHAQGQSRMRARQSCLHTSIPAIVQRNRSTLARPGMGASCGANVRCVVRGSSGLGQCLWLDLAGCGSRHLALENPDVKAVNWPSSRLAATLFTTVAHDPGLLNFSIAIKRLASAENSVCFSSCIGIAAGSSKSLA